jgi:hypothetical protein
MRRVAKDTALAPIIIKSLRCTPYNIHNVTPAPNWTRVNPLTSSADRVFHILRICGTNPNIVNEAAATPNTPHNICFPVYSSLRSGEDRPNPTLNQNAVSVSTSNCISNCDFIED